MQTQSQLTIEALQTKMGSADFKNLQALRARFWSFITYAEAGQVDNIFFGSALGQNGMTLEQTNMPKAGSFGQQHFQIKSIATVIKIKTWDLATWAGTHLTTLYADYAAGLAQAGVLEMKINARPFCQVIKPFMYMPPFDGEPIVNSAGLETLTLTEATPNTLLTTKSSSPWAAQLSLEDNKYLLDPNVLVEAEQSFEVSIRFPSGLIPVLGTSITDDTTNPLQIGVILDGIVYRPLQ